MDGADDVVDRIEQAWILGEEPVDVGSRPRFVESFWGEAATNPRSTDASNRAVDHGVAALNSKRSDRCWIEAAGRVGVDNHRISIVQSMLCDKCVIQKRTPAERYQQ